MQSQSPRLPDSDRARHAPDRREHAGGRELATMRKRFNEALRRAEITTIINNSDDEQELAERLVDELSEAFDAELTFLLDCAGDDPAQWELLAAVGLTSPELPRLRDGVANAGVLASDAAMIASDPEAIVRGGRAVALCAFRAEPGGGERYVLGAVRLYAASFDPAERALLDSITANAGRALQRLAAIADRDELLERTRETFRGTAEALANALEAKDDYTADHARVIADLAVAVGERLGLEGEALEDLRYGAIFHDIGKIAIPDSILNKQGPLTDDEYELIKTHPVAGERILAPIPFLSPGVRRAVRHDHERWDGRGYPDGLAGEEIPLEARIVFVVDAYHAMTSDRPYRRALDHSTAERELLDNAGTQFDPAVVSAFLETLSQD